MGRAARAAIPFDYNNGRPGLSITDLCIWPVPAGKAVAFLKPCDLSGTAGPVREAQAYVAAHYGQKLTLREVAGAVHLSKNYFSFLFRAQTGLTFTQYVNRLRVEKSKEYLRCTSLPIVEVMLRVGFEDQSYFSKVFKQNTRLSPGQYRAQRPAS